MIKLKLYCYFKGFRDNYSELIKEGYKIQIPTCDQLEKLKKLNQNDDKNQIDQIDDKIQPTKKQKA